MGNRDDEEYTRVAQELGSVLQVQTRLETRLLPALAERTATGADASVRALLLVANAGDGKSHLMELIHSSWTASRVHVATNTSDVSFSEPGLHLMNDPSQLDPDVRASFLGTAFGAGGDAERVFVAGINRGLLREIIRDVGKRYGDAADWLTGSLVRSQTRHHPDAARRLAVPLDLRVLVSPPRQPLAGAPAWKLAHQVLTQVADERPDAGLDPANWSDRIVVGLCLVEACGYHVTFREALALTACVAEGLIASEHDVEARQGLAFGRLFQDPESFEDDPPPPALTRIRRILRRMDPAHVANPVQDGTHYTRETRDLHARRDAWDALVAYYQEPAPEAQALDLPLRSAVPFLSLAGRLGDLSRCALAVDATLTDAAPRLGGLGPEILGGLRERLRTVSLDAEGRDANEADGPPAMPALRDLFRGIARVAWGPHAGSFGDEIMPLTTPVQPGSDPQGRWRVLRAAIGLDRARFVADVVDPGPHIERGLTMPALRFEGPPGHPPSPRLDLDLELFETLSRIGRMTRVGGGELGSRETQVQTWIDGVVAGWERALKERRTGFVVFQTLIGDSPVEPVALRPPRPGPDSDRVRSTVERAAATRGEAGSTPIDAARKLWPSSTQGTRSIASTPSAFASGLLHWAGFRGLGAAASTARRLDRREGKARALREALGCSLSSRIRRRVPIVPAFPWSVGMLDVALRGDVSTSFDEGSLLGAAAASALGVDADPWRGALRRAWARDEEHFDHHPTSLLAHQWLGEGLGGRQLLAFLDDPPATVDPDDDLRQRVLATLLADDPPFTRTHRWWLIGGWAAWWTWLDVLSAFHDRNPRPDERPVLLPRVDGDASEVYKRCFDHWFPMNWRKGDPADRDPGPLVALGLASGFLQPVSAWTRFELRLSGLQDLVRMLALRICQDHPDPTDRTVARLQAHLLDCGLWLRGKGGAPVRDRMPPGAMVSEEPPGQAYDHALMRMLASIGLLDTGSDGATLIRAPWQEERHGAV